MNVKPVVTRAESQAQTRQALIDAGAELFIERGFHAASVEAIAERAGYTRGAFYSNFASKEELFGELLHQRVYDVYRRMITDSRADERPSLRETGERLAAIQEGAEGSWPFRLWLEMLSQAGRDLRFREIAAGFWRGNRERMAAALDADYRAADAEPPAPSDHMATALIALDIGLAIQHYVDPDGVPLSLYPELYDLLFSRHRT